MTIDPAPEFDNGQLAILEHSESAVIFEYVFVILRVFVQGWLPFYPEFYLLPVLVLVELLNQSLNLLLIPRTEVYKHLRHRPTRELPQSRKCSGVGFDCLMAVFQWL